MSLLTNKLCVRQQVLALAITLTFQDFVDNDNVIDIDMPVDARLVGGAVTVATVFNGTGTDVLDVGDAGSANRYGNDINLEAAARTALTLTGAKTTAANKLRLTRVPGGSDATAGTIYLDVLYVIEGAGIYQQG